MANRAIAIPRKDIEALRFAGLMGHTVVAVYSRKVRKGYVERVVGCECDDVEWARKHSATEIDLVIYQRTAHGWEPVA